MRLYLLVLLLAFVIAPPISTVLAMLVLVGPVHLVARWYERRRFRRTGAVRAMLQRRGSRRAR